MKIAITGGTGLVGKALAAELANEGHQVYILTRKSRGSQHGSNIRFVRWLNDGDGPVNELEGTECIINLAGESISNGRWTPEQKDKIKKSRMQVTEEVLKIAGKLHKQPKVLINASAVGFYGTSLQKIFTENSTEPGNDFLAQTVVEWENTAGRAASEYGIRTVFCRFGIILDRSEGALPRMALPYKLFFGGTVGAGDQWVSWIHLKDVVRGIIFCLENEHLNGPVNFTTPHPVTMKTFGKALGAVLHRPHWLPVPSMALKIVLGKMSSLVLEGQKVLPEQLEMHGFTFSFPKLENALKDIFR